MTAKVMRQKTQMCAFSFCSTLVISETSHHSASTSLTRRVPCGQSHECHQLANILLWKHNMHLAATLAQSQSVVSRFFANKRGARVGDDLRTGQRSKDEKIPSQVWICFFGVFFPPEIHLGCRKSPLSSRLSAQKPYCFWHTRRARVHELKGMLLTDTSPCPPTYTHTQGQKHHHYQVSQSHQPRE